MPEQVEQWCEEADRFQFAAVCVYPAYVRTAAERGKQTEDLYDWLSFWSDTSSEAV